MTRAEEEAAMAAHHQIEKLPARTASAPPINLIRKTLRQNGSISFNRDRGRRAIVFKGTKDAGTPVHDEGGGRMRRWPQGRSPNRNGTLL